MVPFLAEVEIRVFRFLPDVETGQTVFGIFTRVRVNDVDDDP